METHIFFLLFRKSFGLRGLVFYFTNDRTRACGTGNLQEQTEQAM